jgi:pantoate--beta-alanine ligase
VNVVRTVAGMREALSGAAEVGLVPTMGAFHAGHRALFRAARVENRVVVVSLFVNPTQFAAGEDLARYPRDEAADLRVAEGDGIDVVFAPSAEEMYPPGFQTWVNVENLARVLEGEHRPGHFRGVATVCLKLFTIVRPQRVYFGQKDAQQAALIRRLVGDLALDLEVRVVPTVRDADGLALSSRNVHLSPEGRSRALALPRALAAGRAAHQRGEDAVAAARAVLDGLATDYVEVAELEGQLVLAAAARVGTTRLIDNVVLEGDPQ